MSKIISDKSTRKQAIPFVATPFDGVDYSGTTINLDQDKIISSDLLVPIRMSTPRHSNLVEAHLNLIMAVTSALTVKVAIGQFSGVQAVTSYTQADIDKMHAAITGSSSAIASVSSTLLIDGLNLKPYLPKRGDSDFNEDGFVLLLQFSRARTTDTLTKFEAVCSCLMGLI